MFQSTHPRRVWRSITSFSRARSVSIHTPTQGVTFYHLLKINFYPVSIHTPTQGVTISPHSRRPTGRSFNPHTHAGCDPGTGYLACRIPAVSIHTPTQGVTLSEVCTVSEAIVSIHTPTQGVTTANGKDEFRFTFQSTHPRRVWQKAHHISLSINRFNPHTHAGCDKGCNEMDR